MREDPALQEAAIREWRRRAGLFEGGVTVRRALDPAPSRWAVWWHYHREPWGTRWLFVWFRGWTLMFGIRRSASS